APWPRDGWIIVRNELRCGAAVVDPCHLPGELPEIARGLGRDEERDVVAVARQRDVARRGSPMLAVVEVGAGQCPTLAFVDRSRIAVPHVIEFTGRVVRADLEFEEALRRSTPRIKRDRDPIVLDGADRADRTIDETGGAIIPLPCRTGKLHAVANRERD